VNAIDILTAEHGLIRQFLDNLAIALGKMERGEKVPLPFFEQLVTFSREFVDKYHHGKEELQMFTLLAQKASGDLDTAIAGLRNQHETGRNHIAAINFAKEGYDQGKQGEMDTLIQHLAGYIAMLRNHINREDHHLYPMARRALTPDEMEGLLVEYRRIDEKAGEDFFAINQERVLKMGSLLSAG